MSSSVLETQQALSSGHSRGSTQQRISRVLEQLPLRGQDAVEVKIFDEAALLAPMQRVNQVVRNFGVEFILRQDDGRIITRLVDRESGELIRQIPGEEVLKIAERLDELSGLLVEEQA